MQARAPRPTPHGSRSLGHNSGVTSRLDRDIVQAVGSGSPAAFQAVVANGPEACDRFLAAVFDHELAIGSGVAALGWNDHVAGLAAAIASAFPDRFTAIFLTPRFQCNTWIVAAFGQVQRPEVREWLIGALHCWYEDVRSCAALALGEFPGERTERALLGALQDDEGRSLVPFRAAMSLGKVGTPRAIPALSEFARTARGASGLDVEDAIRAIGVRHRVDDDLMRSRHEREGSVIRARV